MTGKALLIALAVAVTPGAIPLTAGVLAYRTLRRFVLRRRVRRIVVSYGRTWNPEMGGEA